VVSEVRVRLERLVVSETVNQPSSSVLPSRVTDGAFESVAEMAGPTASETRWTKILASFESHLNAIIIGHLACWRGQQQPKTTDPTSRQRGRPTSTNCHCLKTIKERIKIVRGSQMRH
jgi:hypothetical protein